MSNQYEEILKNSQEGGGGIPVEEGAQKILLKEIKIPEFDSDFHDVGLTVVVAPMQYPDWDITQTIWGDWNINKNQNATIWKLTSIFDIIADVHPDDIDITGMKMFDTSISPAQLIEENVEAINKSFDTLEVYGYLYQARKKSSDADRLFWQVHYKMGSKEGAKPALTKSFNGWKNNQRVQQYYLFEEDVENTNGDSGFGSEYAENAQEQKTLQESGF